MKHKILIVDDEDSILFVIKEAFIANYEVFTANNGAAALEIIKREKPSFVFLDIKMPDMNGVEVLEGIKDAGVSPIVWMLTGDDSLDMAMETLSGGASGYITKPFDLVRIRTVVASALLDLEQDKKAGNSEKPWHVDRKKPK